MIPFQSDGTFYAIARRDFAGLQFAVPERLLPDPAAASF